MKARASLIAIVLTLTATASSFAPFGASHRAPASAMPEGPWADRGCELDAATRADRIQYVDQFVAARENDLKTAHRSMKEIDSALEAMDSAMLKSRVAMGVFLAASTAAGIGALYEVFVLGEGIMITSTLVIPLQASRIFMAVSTLSRV